MNNLISNINFYDSNSLYFKLNLNDLKILNYFEIQSS